MKPSEQSAFDKSFRRSRLAITFFIGFVFVLIVAWWIALAVLGYKAVNAVGEAGGVKPVIEQLWCGKPGCFGEQP